MRFLAVLWCLCLMSSSVSALESQELFNGRDLAGWQCDPTIWSVENGLLTGQTKTDQDIERNTFLMWKGPEVEDFVLRVVFRLEGDNNSGVQYRSRWAAETGQFSVVGYQADIHSTPNYTAMLHEEGGRGILAERGQKMKITADGDRDTQPLPQDAGEMDLSEWNELVIEAVGNRLIHKLNGKVTVDVTDDDGKRAASHGIVALQVHRGPAMKVQFKSVTLKRLSPTQPVGGKVASRSAFDATATPVSKINLPEGFEVELLYSIPKEEQGSWVSMCVDPEGRLIVSDQYGGLYRVNVPAKGKKGAPKIERVPADIGESHGMLWAFDSLYVVVNSSDQSKNGLYRVRDTNNDDQLDSVELLRQIDGEGEHGPHTILLTPDKKSLYVVCGNNTKPMEVVQSRVPPLWDEDQLMPRIYGVGFMRGTPAPAGAIYRIDPDGKAWERVASGFRNQFDAALNADGELFTFDADMEWDLGTPWYRPTRVCHVVSGGEWGWRNGSAKWPVYFADNLPPVVNIGLSSPTGITFGYGAKFPDKYQKALFLCDWTYGKMYAVHMEPEGSSYTGTFEEFMTATPLPLTDVVIHPQDGAMYFLIGGRKTQSGLYRLTYAGKEPTVAVSAKQEGSQQRAIRHELEALHVGDHPDAVEKAWPYLKHEDRFLRFAARTAIEHRPLENWQNRALAETDAQAELVALMALARKIPRSYKPDGLDLDTPVPTYPADDAARHPLQQDVLNALGKLDWFNLSKNQKLELLRVYELVFYRMGPPDEASRRKVIARLDAVYPAGDRELNVMLTELLCYLQSPTAAAKGMQLLAKAPIQEEQIDFVRSLRFLNVGWTRELHRELFEWFHRAAAYKGGNNFEVFKQELKRDCLAHVSEADRAALDDVINAPVPEQVTPLAAGPRPFVREWTMAEVIPLVETKLNERNFENGRSMFAAANCFGCHHFAQEGGAVGPDLTGLAGRFSARDVLESVLEPDKVISDQYAAVVIQTTEGKVITGRLTNFNGDVITVNTNMLDPNATESVNRAEIEQMQTATSSMMPTGLLNTLNEQELLDLMAFLLSRGNPQDPMFVKETSGSSTSGGR